MKISDLVNKVEPFRFEFDGEVVEGTYYKYRTTTPNYAKEAAASVEEALTEGTEEEKAKKRDEMMAKAGFKAVADTIISWNVEDDEGKPVPLTMETFEQLPEAFTQWFIELFNELRSPTEKKSPALPSS